MATTYTVKKGDTLSAIAAKVGISLKKLIDLNPQIKNPNLINPGQTIITAAPTPTASKAAPTGNNDAQNAARIEAELIASDKAAAEEAKKAYALSPAGIAAANAAYNAANPSATTMDIGSKAEQEAADEIAKDKEAADKAAAEVDNFQASIDEAAGMDSTPNPDSVEFASLTSEQQAAIGGLDTNQGLSITDNLTVEAAGKYVFNPKTGALTLNGQPYNGSYNGFDYVDGIKKGATTKDVVDLNFDKSANPLTLTGPSDTELARLDAFAQLQDLFESYNLGSLAGKITEYMKAGKGPNETVLLLKQSPEYNLRFQGNTLRKASGLNVMSEAAYLELEDSYANTLRAYGLGNMLSTDRTKNEAMFAKYMGNDLAAPEFKNRIALATDRVINADPGTKETFKKFFPNITDADLVSYFLSPKDTLSKLQEKATTAEIGGVALSQGLTTSLTSATDLAKFGVDRAAAVQGYAAIKEVLPTSQKLGSIYDEAGIKYDQASGEAEFLKLNEDARLKRKRLESLERGSFSGSSGNAANAYKTNIAGQI
jgi:LysM repeat protein